MTLAAVSTALSISITLLIITLVVVSLLMILVVMMQRPKQEGLGAAFGGGMTDQLLGAGTTSFLQKATVILGILFFVLSLILGILVGRSNKQQGITTQAAVPTEQKAAPAIADDIQIIEDGDEDELLKAIETAAGASTLGDAAETVEGAMTESSAEVEVAVEETSAPEVEEAPAPVEGEEGSTETPQ
ncbi:MAG: preprotein translocase subunit SecG [Roseibacillus sp.]